MHTSPAISRHTRGYILVLSLVFLGIFFMGATAYTYSVAGSVQAARYAVASAQALSLAEAGLDKAISQLNQDANYNGESNTPLGAGTYSITVADEGTNTKRLTATGSVPYSATKTATKIVTALSGIDTTIVSFNYGAQVGAGGLVMNNGSKITGNIYSDGSISGSGIITGDATVASGTPARSLSGVTVNGNARAHTLSSCTVGGDAYYQTISSCTVNGAKHPGSTDMASVPMPISNAQVTSWETAAAAGGITAGPYTINGTTTIGPREINGNLTVNGTITLSGVVWVHGNITFSNGAKLNVAATTGNDGAVLIADNPGSEATSGIVLLSNNVSVSGNGSAGSYPMVLSTNSGSTAITVSNNAEGAIVYAAHGTLRINNNATVGQATAYALTLSNNTEIEFKSGMQSASFSNGSGGSWVILQRTYAIKQ